MTRNRWIGVIVILIATAITVQAAENRASPVYDINGEAPMSKVDVPPLGIAEILTNGGTWEKLTSWQPALVYPWDQRLAVTFEIHNGLWLWEAGRWTRLTSWTPSDLASACGKLFAAFDLDRGLWTYDPAAVGWERVSSWTPTGALVSRGSEGLATDFGPGRGAWNYDCPPPGTLELWVNGAPDGCGGSGCSDANDGLSLGRAKQTIQAAVDSLPGMLMGPATINIADGTYNEWVVVDRRLTRGGVGIVRLVGNETSPQNVVLDGQGTIAETGILVLGIAEIRGIEITGFQEEGLEVNFGLMFVDNCRVIGNGTGTGEAYDGVGVFGARADISNTVIANNGDSGIEIEDGASNVHLSNVEITGNASHGIEVDDSSHVHLGGGTLLIQSNGGIGVRAWDGSSVNFNGEAGLTIQLNAGGSMSARYHSTIRGYGSGTTGSCSADTQSICEP